MIRQRGSCRYLLIITYAARQCWLEPCAIWCGSAAQTDRGCTCWVSSQIAWTLTLDTSCRATSWEAVLVRWAGLSKSPIETARDLLALGAVWNSFIFAARGTTILSLLPPALHSIAVQMWRALRHLDQTGDESMLDDLYRRLPTLDFSQCVLQNNERALRLLTSPECGWNDLGTPSRVWRALTSLRNRRQPPQRAAWVPSALTLAEPPALSQARIRFQPQRLFSPMRGSILQPS